MNSTKTVLALIDLSDSQEDILHSAILHAASSESELLVYHDPSMDVSRKSLMEIKENLERKISEISGKLKYELRKLNVIVESEEVVEGKQLSKLLSQSDLVVLGACDSKTNDHKCEDIISLIDQCPKSALVIPLNGKLNRPERILYCSAYLDMKSEDSLKTIKEIAQRFGSEIRIAHVKTHSGSSNQNKIERSKFEGKFFEPEVKCEYKLIRNRDVIDGINYYIRKKGDNDLVVMIRRKKHVINRFFTPNFTNRMIKKTEIPLLILKENQLN